MLFKDLIHRELQSLDLQIKDIQKRLLRIPDLENGSMFYEIKQNHAYYKLQAYEKGKNKHRYIGTLYSPEVINRKTRRFLEDSLRGLTHNTEALKIAADSLEDCSPEAINMKLPKAYRNFPDEWYKNDGHYEELTTWAKEKYDRNPFPLPINPNTAFDGTPTRSKGEAIIYNTVHYSDIPSRFDAVLEIRGTSGVMHKLYPDFLFKGLDGRLIAWEHLGMMPLDKYAVRLKEKIEEYLDCGFIIGDNLIITSDNLEGCTSGTMIMDAIELIRLKVFGTKYCVESVLSSDSGA